MSHIVQPGCLRNVLLKTDHPAKALGRSHRIPACGVPTPSLLNQSALQTPLIYTSTKLRISRRESPVTCRVSHAVLATNSFAEEQVKKVMLDGMSELQVKVHDTLSGSCPQVEIQVTNSNDSLFLHWGLLCDSDKNWVLPCHHPDGTKVYKNKALRSPFMNTGPNQFLKLEIADPHIEAMEFLLFNETKNEWIKNKGQNFHIQLPKRDMSSGSLLHSSILSIPEDLVQIQAYLMWERKGKQAYTPEQEKMEYEAARAELLEELSKGTSIEELRRKMTEGNGLHFSAVPEKTIPDDLVKVQAYIRWERAGKPIYSRDQQLREFEEARKELQSELDHGTSLDEIRNRFAVKSVQTESPKQIDAKKGHVEKIYRKRRDIHQLINKIAADSVRENYSLDEKPLSIFDHWLRMMEDQIDGCLLRKERFRIDQMQLVMLSVSHSGKTKIYAATDTKEALILHWALSRTPGEWVMPKLGTLLSETVLVENAYETHFSPGGDDGFFQFLEIEVDGDDFVGMPFVLLSNGSWIKNGGCDFYFGFGGRNERKIKDTDVIKGIAKELLDRIAELEVEAERSFMHRFNIAADMLEWSRDFGTLGLAGILVWLRFMATRQLTWNKNYNVKPREISKAQDRFTAIAQRMYVDCPQHREILRLIMSTVGRGGEGDVGQRIRDEILVIQRNNDCKGGMMEEWHQKLHNNTSPDDVVICQALIDYIKSGFKIDMYWNTLKSNGITKERLLSYDRPIHSEPNFSSGQKEGLLRDLGHYLRTLKAVHSGADLESAIATCLGYKAEGEGFMVGVQVNPISGLPSGFPGLLQYILRHIEDKNIEPLLECLLEARLELRPLLLAPHDRLKDLIFLDIALDSAVRSSIESVYEELSNVGPEKLISFIKHVVENLALSLDDNEDLIYCAKGWNHALDLCTMGNDEWALFGKAVHDRTHLALLRKAEDYHDVLQPSAKYLGTLLDIDEWAINIFTEEIIRAGSAASLSNLLNRLDPILRQRANLGSWQIISPVEVTGYVEVVNKLISVQNMIYGRPTVLVTEYVKGEEEIPDGVVGVLTSDTPDVLSHVSVRARNSRVLFATCFDPKILAHVQAWKGQLLQLKPMAASVHYSHIQESDPSHAAVTNQRDDGPSPALVLHKKEFAGKFAIKAEDFNDKMVGAKSRNISYLKGRLPDWINVPISVALPFGVMEKIFSDDLNVVVAKQLHNLIGRLRGGDITVLSEIRSTVLQLRPPKQLVQELMDEMRSAGMPWPGDESEDRWNLAWTAIKKVWASKWNERAYLSTKKVKLNHDFLCMAVLVQEIINADYAFVIHTTDPSSGDSSQIYAEVVKGLGETLVGAYPGRALSFVCSKKGTDSPKVVGYPSKPFGLFIRKSIIFRSDSNGEDLEGYAGAGLYDSLPMDEEEKVILDYTLDPLIIDGTFRHSILSKIAQAGLEIEKLFGFPQDIEGVVKDGMIYVVQTRPQM